ncbi:XRE family transcriptional regulator [Streptomyces sp. CC208A]|uniref:MmyB family transcriptional regulator n=1 Tax=Streptomyces sp. CC208A TaxID=3044573 RepID=UPI0024A8F9E9|nr:XRE family transcriptional regulator [Streptomyces sp. CC208A]
MGFAGQLRCWRRAAGERRGRRVTQGECANAIDRSERWYRDLERGAGRHRLDRKQCEALADLLHLDRDEFIALLLYNGLGPTAAAGAVDTRVRSGLRLLIDKQMPSPTFLCDANWNVVAHNAATAEWWPWVLEPGANFMRWSLLSREARSQYHDWDRHAATYVSLLKFALAGREDSAELMELIGDVCKDPDIGRIWDASNEVTENLDGYAVRMTVPALNWDAIDVVSHVLSPASLPDWKLVVLSWGTKDDEDGERTDANVGVGSAAEAPSGKQDDAPPSAAETRRIARAITGRLSVPTAQDAAALAGEDRIDLPVLSRMMGPNCQLTLSPSAQSVIWAVKEADGQWGVNVVAAYTLVVKVPHAAVIDEARDEMQLLTRAILPPEPREAVARIQELIRQSQQRIKSLTAVWRDLYEEDRTLPYIWHPADEI